LGFVSDDYGHLVEAAKFSPISSTDGLHRPLRNIAFKIAHATFGLNPAPYHLVLISLHLVLVGLLYRFVLLLGGGRYAAFIAAAIFGFFPRNHQSLFWVAAGQDTVVAICSLVACSAFLLHKGTGRSVSYFIALASFSIALGFKETATAILPLLLLVDLSHRIKNSNASPKHRWRAYVPFVIIAGAYLVWVFGERLFGPAEITQSFYRFQNASQSVKLAAKFILNMLLPLSSPVEVKEVVSGVLPFMTVSLGVLTIAIASFWLVRMDKLALTTGWILISMAPTAVFGFYTDRYLLMPFLGMAMLLGFIAEAIVGRARTNKLPIGLIITAALFPLCVRFNRSFVALSQKLERGCGRNSDDNERNAAAVPWRARCEHLLLCQPNSQQGERTGLYFQYECEWRAVDVGIRQVSDCTTNLQFG
jgi:MFS family permease